MAAELPLVALPLVFYGAGIGIKSIARGTVPLALFGPERYPQMMGKLALPSLLAQALAPFAAAILIERGGPGVTLLIFTVVRDDDWPRAPARAALPASLAR